MEKFIRVNFYPRHLVREGSVSKENLKVYGTYIRLDSFLQVDDLEPLKVYDPPATTRSLKMSHCYLTRVIGLGINGMSSDIYLTEESYNDLVLALGLSPQKLEAREIHIG